MRKLILLASLVISINSFGQIPTNGLVGYWPFNGNANDESGNGHNGTVNGPTLTTDRFGNANSAYYFNGIHKIVTTFQGVGGNHDRSISFWVKTGTSPAGYICYYGGGSGTGFNPIVNITGAGIDISNSTIHYKSASNSDEWHHFVFIFSTQYGTSLNGLKIYRDKVLLNEVSESYNSTAYSINTSLSNFTMGAASAVQYYLDDVRFYNSVLSTAEIEALYNENQTDGLVGYWPFNGNANDESGNGHDGTVDGPTLTTDRFGNANSAYYFNGNHKIVTTFQGVGGNHDRSISFWVKTGTFPAGICSYGGGFGTSFNPILNITGAGIDISNSTLHYKSASNSDEWHHFVFIFSTQYGTSLNGLKIYRDNVLLNEVSGGYNSTAYTINTSLSNFTMGTGSAQYYLDDVRFYNSVLTQSEISALYYENICVQSITVTDTLIINANITGFNPIQYANTIKVYPNPANDLITIDCGNNYGTLNGYTIKIANSLSQTVYTSKINQQSTSIKLNSWTGKGIYFLHIIDANSNTIDIKKIVLQ